MRHTALSTSGLIVLIGFAFVASVAAAPITVTGCLAKGGDEGEFQLTHVTGGDAVRYELIAGKDVDLQSHLGHKVEITGEKATAAEEKGGEAGAEERPHEHLKVSSLKHLAATCP